MTKARAIKIARFEANAEAQIRYVFVTENGEWVARGPHDIDENEARAAIVVMPEPFKHAMRVKV